MKLPPLKGVLIHIIYWTLVAILTVISTAIGIIYQRMTCDVRSQVASCDVRVRTHFGETCDVGACGAFLGVRSAIPTLQLLW